MKRSSRGNQSISGTHTYEWKRIRKIQSNETCVRPPKQYHPPRVQRSQYPSAILERWIATNPRWMRENYHFFLFVICVRCTFVYIFCKKLWARLFRWDFTIKTLNACIVPNVIYMPNLQVMYNVHKLNYYMCSRN